MPIFDLATPILKAGARGCLFENISILKGTAHVISSDSPTLLFISNHFLCDHKDDIVVFVFVEF